jgi:hypothetical protein
MPRLWDGKGRVCNGPCKQYKTWDQFNKNKNGPFGHRSVCKSCQKIADANYTRDPQKNRDNFNRWYARKKDEINTDYMHDFEIIGRLELVEGNTNNEGA